MHHAPKLEEGSTVEETFHSTFGDSNKSAFWECSGPVGYRGAMGFAWGFSVWSLCVLPVHAWVLQFPSKVQRHAD